jgi:hypothetical protein
MAGTLEPSAPIEFVCVTDDHLRRGLGMRDQSGHITIVDGKWAYCTAGRKDEPHDWRPIAPTPLPALGHADLARTWGDGRTKA